MTTGLRERKRQATRRGLHEAALRLVAERGLDDVSIEDIAGLADVSARTFFNYFSSKDEAIIGLDPSVLERQADAFRNRPGDESALQAMRAIAHAQAEEMTADRELWPLRLQVVDRHPTLAGRLATAFAHTERALALAIAERTGTRVDVDAYPTLLAGAGAAAMRSALSRWRAGGFTASLSDLVDEAWDVLAAGLPAPPH